jgi:hypothetical protein
MMVTPKHIQALKLALQRLSTLSEESAQRYTDVPCLRSICIEKRVSEKKREGKKYISPYM